MVHAAYNRSPTPKGGGDAEEPPLLWYADCVAMRFNTIGVSDGISMGTDGMSYSLQSRDRPFSVRHQLPCLRLGSAAR